MKPSLPLRCASSASEPPCIAPGQARRLHLAAQGLLQPPARRASRDALLACVERMRLLQIDSIHVVARSPYLVLHARLGAYPPTWLDDALAHGQVAEGWAHEACFVPAADVALHRRWGQRHGHWAQRSAARMRAEHPLEMDALLRRIQADGPMRASDFPSDNHAPGGWWQWKPEKRWLEAWFALGELMVTRRERFQRIYDVAGRVLAKLDPPFAESELTPAAIRRRFILDSVRALGIAQARWIADYYRLRPAVSVAELEPLLATGDLLAVQVKGWAAAGYVHRDHADLLAQAARGRLRGTHTALLSPFDPVVWDRARALAMFGFEYTLECYTPASKRCHGYYVLPILHRGELIGRLDAKAHRADGVFEIKALYLEPRVMPDARMLDELAVAVAHTAQWHGTPVVRLLHCEPPALAHALRQRWGGNARVGSSLR